MAFSHRINLLPSYQPGDNKDPPGFDPEKSAWSKRTADLAFQVVCNPPQYLSAAVGNLYNCSTDTQAQKVQLALTPIANSSRISQHFSQLLYPELDDIWPKLDLFPDLMSLDIDQIDAILTKYSKRVEVSNNDCDRYIDQILSSEPPKSIGGRACDMLGLFLRSTIKSYRSRFLSIYYLHCASLCTARPALKERADQHLVSGLRAAIITHTSSANSAAAGGLMVTPMGTKGSCIALLHMQDQALDRLDSLVADEKKAALIALKSCYIARAGVILMQLFDQFKRKVVLTKQATAFKAFDFNAICQKLLLLIKSILNALCNLFSIGDQKNSQDAVLENRSGSTAPSDKVSSPAKMFDEELRCNSLSLATKLATPENSPEKKRDKRESSFKARKLQFDPRSPLDSKSQTRYNTLSQSINQQCTSPLENHFRRQSSSDLTPYIPAHRGDEAAQ